MITYCGCTISPEFFKVKSAGSRDKSRVAIPFLNRGLGAAYQDSQYGRGNRVHNLSPKGKDGHTRARCTVCGTQKII